MLKFLKAYRVGADKVYEVTMRVEPLEGSTMPRNLRGALVPCYVPASDHLEATKLAFRHLSSQKFDVIEVVGEVRQINISKWHLYVQQVWSDFHEHFPNQIEFERRVKAKLIVVGPFISYEEE